MRGRDRRDQGEVADAERTDPVLGRDRETGFGGDALADLAEEAFRIRMRLVLEQHDCARGARVVIAHDAAEDDDGAVGRGGDETLDGVRVERLGE